jgi:hypothetical protein
MRIHSVEPEVLLRPSDRHALRAVVSIAEANLVSIWQTNVSCPVM